MIDRAIDDYSVVLRLDPTLADIYNARGELWRKKGDRPRALQDFGAALKLNPDQPAAKSQLQIAGAGTRAPWRAARGQRQAKLQLRHRQASGREGDLRQSGTGQSRSPDQRGEYPGGSRRQPRQSARRPRPAARAGRFHHPAQCRLRPAGLRSPEGDAGAAGSSAGDRALANPLALTARRFLPGGNHPIRTSGRLPRHSNEDLSRFRGRSTPIFSKSR